MPEGPSLVIAVEELKGLKNQKVLSIAGNSRTEKERLVGKKILDVFSYGKYLNFQLDDFALRIHFMLFGSFRVDEEREGRAPRLVINTKNHQANFYACSVKFIEDANIRSQYDFRTDIMSPLWDRKFVLKKIKENINESVDDILMDQTIFTGVGNIIKNEVLFRQRLHPSTKAGELSGRKLGMLTDEARAYSHQFYVWKKQYVLRKNYTIYRKGKCPNCGGKITHMKTGKRERMSHFCVNCQV